MDLNSIIEKHTLPSEGIFKEDEVLIKKGVDYLYDGNVIPKTNDINFYNELIQDELCYNNRAEYFFYKKPIVKLFTYFKWWYIIMKYKEFWMFKNKFKY